MYRTSVTAADERLRAAIAALAEAERLVGLRAALIRDVEAAAHAAEQQGAALVDEQRDVERYTGGLWAFLYGLVADVESRLTKEQLEAAQAEVLHRETVAVRDRLHQEVLAVSARLEASRDAPRELAAARAGKAAELLASGGPRAEELVAFDEQLGRADSEALAIDEAFAAGHRVLGSLGHLTRLLASVIDDSEHAASRAERHRFDAASYISGAVQSELLVFQRELADVGWHLPLPTSLLDERGWFTSNWMVSLVSEHTAHVRVRNSQRTVFAVQDAVEAGLQEMKVRRAALHERATALLEQRLRSLEE